MIKNLACYNLAWHQYPLGLLFIASGFLHFFKPLMYQRMMPPYFPFRRALVFLTGIGEITAGIGLCLFNSHQLAAWVIIVMLIAFFPVHIHMLQDQKLEFHLPKTVLFLRLLLQFVLIYWAAQYI